MSEQTRSLVEVIRQRLHAVTRRITLAELLFGLVLTLGIVAALWLVLAAVEAGFWLGVGPRRLALAAFGVVALGLLGYFLVLPALRLAGVLRGPSEAAVARRIGTRYPEVSDRLVNLLDLVDGRSSEAPAPLLDGAVRMLGEQVRGVPFEQVETFDRAKRASRLASVPLVGLLLFLLAAPSVFLGASGRLLAPGEHFQRPAPFSLSVEPGDVDLVKGETLEIVIRAEGPEGPGALVLALSNEGEDHVEEIRLVADSTGAFRHTLPNVRRSLRYRAAAAPVETAWYRATVTERPLVRNLQVHLTFPRYTGIPPQRLVPNVGDVTALPGTRVGVAVAVAGRDLDGAYLRFGDGRMDTLRLDGDRAEGAFTLRRDDTYQVVLRTTRGVENDDPITYTLRLVADAHPSVVILAPEPVAELDESMRQPIRVRIHDDFGFSGLRLFYRLAESRFGEVMDDFQSRPLPAPDPRQLDQEIDADWLVTDGTGLDPVPGDVIEYYVEVRDNDAVAGFKPARSATHRLRLASLAEQYEQLDDAQEQAEDALEEMLDETDAIREQFEQLRDELRRKQEGDWEDKRQLEQVQQRQQQLEQRVDELSSQIQQMTEQMEENNLVSEETLEQYRELQRVAEEINSPELMDALRQLQEAMQQLNMEQMQESLENFQFNEQQYQQRLERTLDLMKNLQVQQKLDEAARRAEELAEREEKIADETERLQNDEAGEDREGDPDGENEGDPDGENEGDPDGENEGDPDGENEGDESQQGENQEGESQQGENQESENQDGERSGEDPEERAEELAREQERTAEEMKALEEQMQEILEKMQDVRNAPNQEMRQLQQQTQQQQLPQQMQENAEQLRQQEFQPAQQQQQQMQQQLQQLQSQLQQMQQNMQGQQMQMNMAGLRQALSDVLTLSQQQEGLRTEVANAAPDSPNLRSYAQRQVELSEGLSVVSDSLQRLAKDIPQMTRAVQQQAGDALRAMSSATGELADRSSRQASGQQKTAMMHLNELALMLSDLMNQMMNAQQ
ncbi:MAG: DUF4175 family protein, partial [Rhodothermales bacterium]|nr:DUF4175 family protein [Rhodothermales bacterium]